MVRPSSYPETSRAPVQLPPAPLPKVPAGEKHLDATLLAVVGRRRLETSVMPGVPFN